MPKMDLAKQISSMQYDESSVDDFEDIIDSKVLPVSDSTQIYNIPMELLVEYNDEQFKSITGRPQPFITVKKERLSFLLQPRLYYHCEDMS